jgi:hypothetical protein
MLATLCLIAFLRSFLEWAFDHMAGDGRFSFNVASLGYLVPVAAIIAFILTRKEGVESVDTGVGQLQLFALNVFLAMAVLYVVWDQQGFTAMFVEKAPESYPFPYRGTILLMTTWIGIVLTLQMIETVIVALKDARTNVYEEDLERY